MAYFDVYKQITDRLATIYSIDQYMPFPKKWDSITATLQTLKPAGKHPITLDGRLDIASYQIYEDPMLDWILLLYNRIYGIGEDDITVVQKTLNLLLDPLESQSFDVTIRPYTLTDPSVFTYYDPITNIPYTKNIIEDGNPYGMHASGIDIFFKQNESGVTTITNRTALTYDFQVTYLENFTDERLRAGQTISYPALEDINKMLIDTNAVAATTTSGFARL